MNKVNAFLLLAILVLLVSIAYVFSMKNVPADNSNDANTDDQGEVQTQTEDDFTLEYMYEGDSAWSYTVTGNLPTPCYDAELEAIVAESFPEQVTVRLIITPPDRRAVCVQVVQEYEESGEFSASEGASVNFVVEKGVE